MYKEEQQKSTRMTKRIKSLEKELTLNEPLGQAKGEPISLTQSMIFGHPSRLILNKLI